MPTITPNQRQDLLNYFDEMGIEMLPKLPRTANYDEVLLAFSEGLTRAQVKRVYDQWRAGKIFTETIDWDAVVIIMKERTVGVALGAFQQSFTNSSVLDPQIISALQGTWAQDQGFWGDFYQLYEEHVIKFLRGSPARYDASWCALWVSTTQLREQLRPRWESMRPPEWRSLVNGYVDLFGDDSFQDCLYAELFSLATDAFTRALRVTPPLKLPFLLSTIKLHEGGLLVVYYISGYLMSKLWSYNRRLSASLPFIDAFLAVHKISRETAQMCHLPLDLVTQRTRGKLLYTSTLFYEFVQTLEKGYSHLCTKENLLLCRSELLQEARDLVHSHPDVLSAWRRCFTSQLADIEEGDRCMMFENITSRFFRLRGNDCKKHILSNVHLTNQASHLRATLAAKATSKNGREYQPFDDDHERFLDSLDTLIDDEDDRSTNGDDSDDAEEATEPKAEDPLRGASSLLTQS